MIRTKNGRFSSFKAKCKQAVMIFAIIVLGSAAGTAAFSSSTVTATVPQVIDNTPAKIDTLKASVVDRLAACESAGHTEDEGLVTFDNNRAGTLSARNIPSFGILQFKVSTVQHYEAQQGQKLTGKEATLLALDGDQAKALATYIIFGTDGGIWNWQNCADALKLGDEVTAIKQISK